MNNKYNVGDKLRSNQSGIIYTITEIDTSFSNYRVHHSSTNDETLVDFILLESFDHLELINKQFTREYTGTPIPVQKCLHPNKFINRVIVSRFIYCPDCKQDLGDYNER